MRCGGTRVRITTDEQFRKDIAMNDRDTLTRRVRRGALAVMAAALLAGGATWHGFAAAPQSSQPKAERSTTVTTPAIAQAVAGGRDSYADVVKAVAPAVV